MQVLEMFAIAVALSMDAFAVALAAGLSLRTRLLDRAVRMAVSFGAAQASTVAAGWLLGHSLRFVARISPWIAFGLLSWAGVRMMASALRERETRQDGLDPTGGAALLLLSLGTSMDGFVVGIPLGSLGTSVSALLPITGTIVAAFTLLGVALGARVGRIWERQARFAGGVVMCLVGARFLLAVLGRVR